MPRTGQTAFSINTWAGREAARVPDQMRGAAVAATEVAVAVIEIAGRSRCLFLFEILGMPCGASLAAGPAALHRHFSCLPTWPAYKITPQRFLPAGRKLFERSLRGGGDFGDRLANTDSRIVPALTFSGTARFATYTSRRTSTPKSPKALHLSSSLTDVTPR